MEKLWGIEEIFGVNESSFQNIESGVRLV